MYKGYIYRHWIVNDKGQEKSYIGQVYSRKGNANPQRRWGKDGIGYAPGEGKEPTKFYKAIDKYGWENFQHKVLFSVECETLEELVFWLDEWEKYYIEKYDSFYNGYNSTTGGSNGKIYTEETKQKQSKSMKQLYEQGYIHPMKDKHFDEEFRRKQSEAQKRLYENGYINPRFGVPCEEETKQKISKANTGKKHSEEVKQHLSEVFSGEGNPMYGKTFTQEHRQHISDSLTGRTLTDEHRAKISERTKGENNPMYGVHRYGKNSPHYGHKHTEEYKKQQSERMKGKYTGAKNPKARAVICLETSQVFTTVKEAKKWCGSGAIGMQIKGQRNYAGKHPITGAKLHWMYYDEYEMLTKEKELKN